MAIIVETGVGLSNANSYASVSEADTYHASKGNRLWAGIPNQDKGEWVLASTYVPGNLVTRENVFYKANRNYPSSVTRNNIPWTFNRSQGAGEIVQHHSSLIWYLCVKAYDVPAGNTRPETEPGTDTGKEWWAEYEPVASPKNPLWDVLTDCIVTKEQCLIRSSDFIDQRFGTRFRGYRATSYQALEFPRTDAVDNAGYEIRGVPRKLKNATFEYAIRAATAVGLLPDPLRNTPDQNFSKNKDTYKEEGRDGGDIKRGSIRRIKEVIGPLETETFFGWRESDRGARDLQSGMVSDISIPEYPEADLWLEELLKNTNTVTQLARG